jgi:hypothetical protein
MSCTPGIPSEPRLPPDYLESSPNTNDNENKILDPHDTALNKRGSQLLLYCWSSAIWKIEQHEDTYIIEDSGGGFLIETRYHRVTLRMYTDTYSSMRTRSSMRTHSSTRKHILV